MPDRPDRHKVPTVSVRFDSNRDLAELKEFADRAGISRHAAILRAVREMLARDAAAASGRG